MCCGSASFLLSTVFLVGIVALLCFVVAKGFPCRSRVRPPRDWNEALEEADRLDEREAAENEFQPLFDELLLHLTAGEDPELNREIVRRMNEGEGPSRRMFLQLAAVHPRLLPALRELAESAHPLAPEARELLKRREA